VRVDGGQLRCRVVGEGGNLGLTQLGRIEFADKGGRINTDAIDNSAGVDTSDHEVNLKILLGQAVDAATLTLEERNSQLASVTDEVAALVLRDNYEQNVLLGTSRQHSAALLSVHARMIRSLEDAGELDRDLEDLPSVAELARMAAAGEGLSSPELAVLAAYSKITLTAHLVDSTLPEEAWFARALRRYFPRPIGARFHNLLNTHPLNREIVTTWVVNDMVNRGGITFVHRAVEETGVDIAQVTRAYTVVREIFGLEPLWDEIESLDNEVSTEAQHAAYQAIRRTVDRATRWLVDVRFPISDVAGEIARFAPAIALLSPRVPELLCGPERDTLTGDCDALVALGVPYGLALRISELLTAFLLLDVVEIARAADCPAADVAELHYALSARFSVDEMLTRITELPRLDRWTALARAAMRHDVYAALKAITSAVLRSTDPGPPETRMTQWEKANAQRVARTRSTVAEALGCERVDLAALSVALRVMRSLPS
jgi:glutamate dehydrogenase